MMKFKLLIACLALCSLQAYSQTKRYYCEIKGMEKGFSSRMKIIFDFGQDFSYNVLGSLNPKMRFVDQHGNEIEFNSMVDAMNYMAERGWMFQQAYSTSSANSAPVQHWILYKDAANKEEAKEGILTRHDFEK